MGIKFLCPNGHKLNVKSFLAGRRAICPKCGVSLVVPTTENQANQSDELVATGLAQSDQFSTASVSLTELPRQGARSASAATLGVDAIAEAPSAVWYVRPATGGQFGPASGDVMRAWLNDGRVGASSLVWRAGWAEWRAAAAVFPQLAGVLTAAGSAVAPPQPPPSSPSATATPAANAAPPPLGGSLPQGHVVQNIPDDVGKSLASSTATPALAQVAIRRRQQRDRRLYASAVLVVLSVILLIVLIVVFQRQGRPTESPQTPAAPAADVMS